MISSTLKFGRLSALTTFLSSLALGCVITLGENGKTSDECPDDNSTLSDGKCYCKAFYDWCKPDDLNDLTCCEDTNPGTSNSNGTTTNSSQTTTDNGTTQDIPTSGTTDTPTTTEGTTGDPLDCSVTTDPPDGCEEGTFLCISADNPDCDIEGSKYYACQGGAWVESPADAEAICKSDGFDFFAGCEDNGAIDISCGVGPGTPCNTGEPTSCSTDTVLDTCVFGKINTTDCTAFCMEVGEGGITYDYGFCDPNRTAACVCCDEGEPDCPITEPGETTGGGTSTSGGSSGA